MRGWSCKPDGKPRSAKTNQGDVFMSYHEQARNIGAMVKQYNMTPEQINVMVKFSKIVRRSAKQNTVLWNIVRDVIEGGNLPYQLQLIEKEGRDGKTYEDLKSFLSK